MRSYCKNIVITGTIIIWVIKFIIRPGFHFHHLPAFLLGVAPNLIGSFLIPFGAVWFFEGKKHLLARLFCLRSVNELRFVCISGFLLLVLNEYLQRIPVFGRTFDYYDISASAIGLFVSYFVFGWIKQFSLSQLLLIKYSLPRFWQLTHD